MTSNRAVHIHLQHFRGDPAHEVRSFIQYRYIMLIALSVRNDAQQLHPPCILPHFTKTYVITQLALGRLTHLIYSVLLSSMLANLNARPGIKEADLSADGHVSILCRTPLARIGLGRHIRSDKKTVRLIRSLTSNTS